MEQFDKRQAGKSLQQMLGFLMKLKIYHLTTHKYTRHLASDSLYNKLNDKIDKLFETWQAGSERLTLENNNVAINLKVLSDTSMNDLLLQFYNFLLGNSFQNWPELLAIRDEMLADVDQALYLFSLN